MLPIHNVLVFHSICGFVIFSPDLGGRNCPRKTRKSMDDLHHSNPDKNSDNQAMEVLVDCQKKI